MTAVRLRTGGRPVGITMRAAVLREFVERRYGLSAPKLTTTELLAECERAGWPTEDYHLARSLVDTELPEDDLFAGIRERVSR